MNLGLLVWKKESFSSCFRFERGRAGELNHLEGRNEFGITQAVALLRKHITLLFSPLPLEVLEVMGISCSRNFKNRYL